MTDRNSAKSGIQTTEQSEPELQNVLTEGLRLQLELLKEKNRHKEALQKNELGHIGQWLGGESSQSTTLATIVVGLGVVGVIAGIVMSARHPTSQDFWSKQMGYSYTAIGSALSFVFGRSSKK